MNQMQLKSDWKKRLKRSSTRKFFKERRWSDLTETMSASKSTAKTFKRTVLKDSNERRLWLSNWPKSIWCVPKTGEYPVLLWWRFVWAWRRTTPSPFKSNSRQSADFFDDSGIERHRTATDQAAASFFASMREKSRSNRKRSSFTLKEENES